MLSVDVDEADVAVLTQNLARSKELFADINDSLSIITSKTSTASKSIKPVFAEINALNTKKASIEEGLSLLKNVSRYSLQAADYQRVLASPIDTVGMVRYLNTLEASTVLVREMKQNIRDFDGVVIGFANSVDKAELGVMQHFSKLLTQVNFDNGTVPKLESIVAVLSFYAKQRNLRSAHEAIEKAFSKLFSLRMGPLEASCTLKRRQSNIPYEKGTSGLSVLTAELLKLCASLRTACNQLEVLASPVFKNIITGYMETHLCTIIDNYNGYVDNNGLAGHDVLFLDILDQFKFLDDHLQESQLGIESFPRTNEAYERLVEKCQGLLTEWVKYVDSRVSQIDRLNEHSIPEVVVEVISKIRKISEFGSVRVLMENKKLGSWLDVKPPLRFITVYTSVVQGAEAQCADRTSFLVSSFFLDLIDELMVNIEISLKDQSGESGLRKLSQGFMLVKNLVMIETIVNRLESLYEKLGTIGIERLQRLKKRFLKVFLDDWNYASYIIIRDMTQITTTNAMHGGLNSAKEKEQIKELFRNFNESFEEALKQYERFNIQEKDLKAYLASEIKKLILNAYNKLYDKYGGGEFTKNRSKYIKYDKSQFERLLNDRL